MGKVEGKRQEGTAAGGGRLRREGREGVRERRREGR